MSPVAINSCGYEIPWGMGDAASDAQLTQLVGSGAQLGTTAAITAANAASASGISILGMSASVAIPVIGAALAGVTMLATYLIKNSGCGPTCIQATEYANKAEQLLQTNVQAYMALPAPRTQTQQAAALANFDNIWQQLVNLCEVPALGNAGIRCVTDRQAGACKWTNASGQCWNWFIGYRDPIANDQVVPDSAVQTAAAATGLPQALQSAGISQSLAVPILIGAGLILALVVLQ